MLPDRVSNPGPLIYESSALPIALRGPAIEWESSLTYIKGLLLCSYSPNDVPTEPQRNVSIAAVRGAVRPSKTCFIIDF